MAFFTQRPALLLGPQPPADDSFGIAGGAQPSPKGPITRRDPQDAFVRPGQPSHANHLIVQPDARFHSITARPNPSSSLVSQTGDDLLQLLHSAVSDGRSSSSFARAPSPRVVNQLTSVLQRSRGRFPAPYVPLIAAKLIMALGLGPDEIEGLERHPGVLRDLMDQMQVRLEAMQRRKIPEADLRIYLPQGDIENTQAITLNDLIQTVTKGLRTSPKMPKEFSERQKELVKKILQGVGHALPPGPKTAALALRTAQIMVLGLEGADVLMIDYIQDHKLWGHVTQPFLLHINTLEKRAAPEDIVDVADPDEDLDALKPRAPAPPSPPIKLRPPAAKPRAPVAKPPPPKKTGPTSVPTPAAPPPAAAVSPRAIQITLLNVLTPEHYVLHPGPAADLVSWRLVMLNLNNLKPQHSSISWGDWRKLVLSIVLTWQTRFSGEEGRELRKTLKAMGHPFWNGLAQELEQTYLFTLTDRTI